MGFTGEQFWESSLIDEATAKQCGKLLLILNSLSEVKKILVNDLNAFVPFEKGKEEDVLLFTEKQFDELGVKESDGVNGVSTLSLLATVVRVFTDNKMSLAAETKCDGKGLLYIEGWTMVPSQMAREEKLTAKEMIDKEVEKRDQ